jgi:hypothetical protein
MLIPVARDELLPALLAGKGDIAASNLTVTEERRHLVDFTSPVYRNVSEVVVSGPESPAVSSVDELAGQVVFVRKSSSYYESLMALNQRFRQREQTGGHPQGSTRGSGRRGLDRDAERRDDSSHRRGQAQSGLLEEGLPGYHGA